LERLFINKGSSKFNPIEKQTLFSDFAVAKYSSKFWSQIILE